MAKNSKKATEPSSPRYPSPPPMVGETRIDPRLFRIPKAQRELLQKPESWAQSLKRSSKPFINVPEEVLKNVKECYRQQLLAAQSDESFPSPDPQPSQSVATGSQPLQTAQLGSGSEPEEEGDDDHHDGDDGGGENTSWPSSPVAHKYPPKRTTSEDVEDVEDDEDDEEPQFITQPPISSPQPTMRPAPKLPKLKAPLIFPPSSQEQEEPLEIEVPAAIHDVVLPINKSAVRLNDTPPSAQIVVPCTFDQSEQKPLQKQRIYKKPGEFYRPPKNEAALAALKQHLNVRSRKPNDSPHTDFQSSASTANISSSVVPVSSSFVPSTIQADAPRKDVPAWCINATISPSREPPTTGDESHETQDSPFHQQDSPEYRPQSPIIPSSPPVQRSLRISPPAKTKQVSPSQTPFIRYTITYPSYNGSISDFVTACMYIQLQQQKRRIRTSLYDDFIRAWYEGYLPYVRECDDSSPPVKALLAIDWYNEIDEDPLFTSRIITKQNLNSTLEFYPDELRSARSLLGVSPKPTPEATRGPNITPSIENHRPTTAENAPQVDEDIGVNAPHNEEAGLSKASSITVPLKIMAALPRQQQKPGILPLNKSMSEIEKKPAATRELVRSFSESTHHKRKASEDIGNVSSKRLSVNSLPKSDSGSVTSVNSEVPGGTRQSSVAPSSTSGRKKKYANDQERRAEQFKKHLKKRMERKKESIASSALVSNTPTSAQRE
ncbi:BolA domain UV induced protein Uvi31 [Hypoxylon texense]